ncbi:MAG: CoA pyrophosphatase [Bacteroidetes bacterium]|nr:CoA pyrophosphatase [Bacteroidota bacterium]MBL7104097.1 CoA pyrophosphatase [Bacteroidales bacterium]
MTDFQNFIDKLKERLKKPLPGTGAFLKMASEIRLEELQSSYDTSKAIQSSVLILLFPENKSVKIILILRQQYEGVHSGQVSFPGGRKEKDDKTLIETALRESEEEVGIDADKVMVIGNLTELYIPPSNFLVLPVVGYMLAKPNLKADKSEVAKIIEVDLRSLFDKNIIKEKELDVRGYKIKAPYYDIQEQVVWGATAVILSELLEVIRSIALLGK